MGSFLLWVSCALGGLKRGLTLTSISIYRRWLAWACDAIDFFSVSLTITNLEKQFDRPTHDIVSHASPNLSSHFLSFLHRPDNVHYPHLAVPFHWRCKYQSLFHSPPMPLTPPRHRSSLVSYPTDLAGSGRWSSISSSSLLSPLVVASFKPSGSSSPSGVFSASAWEVSGVWPPPLPSKTSLSRLVVLLVESCSRDTLADTSSPLSSTYTLSRAPPGVTSSGPVPGYLPLLPCCELFFPRAKSFSELDKRGSRNSRSPPSQRHASSFTRSGRCSRTIGCYPSTL